MAILYYKDPSDGLFYPILGSPEAGGGVTDHGALSGLADDDHPQYLTQARGDARYEADGAAYLGDTAHVAASDPHAQYQKESEKAAANGYASLDASTKIPIAQVPTGSTSTTVSLGNHAHSGTYWGRWTGTQAAYDALGSYDTNILYVVTD